MLWKTRSNTYSEGKDEAKQLERKEKKHHSLGLATNFYISASYASCRQPA
jgi:hypothetical protein